MYNKKILQLNNSNKTYNERSVVIKESDLKFMQIQEEVMQWLEKNAHILTKGYKTFKNNEITQREAVNVCLTAEQILEE